MKYFLHDTSAFDDEKVSELFIKFGYEGLGLFYTVLEKLAKQEKPIKTEVLKKQLRVGKKLQKCWNFMEEIGLISSNNGETFNKQLLNFSEKYAIKKEKNAKRISEWRKSQELTENVTCYEQSCNTHKVKESKEYKNSLLSEIKISDYPHLNPNYFKIAISFQELIKQNIINLGSKSKDIDKTKGTAIDEIRLLIESDKFTVDDCRMVHKWLSTNEFWKKNILSIKTLREKFPKLIIEAKNTKQPENTKVYKGDFEAKKFDLNKAIGWTEEEKELIRQGKM